MVVKGYDQCPSPFCLAEYDDAGKLVRVVNCIASDHLKNPHFSSDIEYGKRLAVSCPIDGNLLDTPQTR